MTDEKLEMLKDKITPEELKNNDDKKENKKASNVIIFYIFNL
jgi:hypothetical protein